MRTSLSILSRALGAGLALALAAAASPAAAQQQWKPELRPFVGTTIPTGGLRDVVGSEAQFGMQVAGELRPWLHVLGTVGWSPAETRYLVADRDLDVLRYDAGVEVNSSQPLWRSLRLHPFWGAGAGARTYRYDAAELRDRTCLSGYLSTGMEVQTGRVGARLEGRDNVFCYRSPIAGEKAGTRNELAFSASLVYHFR